MSQYPRHKFPKPYLVPTRTPEAPVTPFWAKGLQGVAKTTRDDDRQPMGLLSHRPDEREDPLPGQEARMKPR